MLGLECIATELEQPFGDDHNDLPCWEMQDNMNRDLLLLLQPASGLVPSLTAEAQSTEEMLDMDAPRKSLAQFISQPSRLEGLDEKGRQEPKMLRPTKLAMQKNWAQQQWPTHDNRMKSLLKMKTEILGFGQVEDTQGLHENVAISFAKEVEHNEQAQIITEPMQHIAVREEVSCQKKPVFEITKQGDLNSLEPCFERHLSMLESLVQEQSAHLQTLLNEQRDHQAYFQKHCLSMLDSMSTKASMRSLELKRFDGGSTANTPVSQWPCGRVTLAARDLQDPGNSSQSTASA